MAEPISGELHEAWKEEPLLGLGPGVYRMNDVGVVGRRAKVTVTNPHNIFMQTLVDCGIVGLVALLPLVRRLLWRIRDPVKLAVFVALLAGHLFENLFDKSMGFVLIAAWFLTEPLPWDESESAAAV